MRQYRIIAFSLLLAFVFSGCGYKRWAGNRPVDQPGTTWISEDLSMHIQIDENQQGKIYIQVDEEEYEFLFTCAAVDIEIYKLEAKDRPGLYAEELPEIWESDFLTDSQFTATVKKTTFFNVGDTITFYRTNNE